MIQKRLLRLVPESKRPVAINVLLQWLGLVINITMTLALCDLIGKLSQNRTLPKNIGIYILIFFLVLILRPILIRLSAQQSFKAAQLIKERLRKLIYEKLLNLGHSYTQHLSTAESVQIATEGVDQLENYFGAYLPQLFYSLLAPFTLLIIVSFLYYPAAIALFLCVPLIPITIMAIQTLAKRVLAKYWGSYTQMGDSFLESLQGLLTLKIYNADEKRADYLRTEAETFRKMTMRVLVMQLNSITVMDLIAYGGAALGILFAAKGFFANQIPFSYALAIVLLSAEFFIPMRALGSTFHIAMNGMAASQKIFRLLDLNTLEKISETNFNPAQSLEIYTDHLSFSYEESRSVINNLTLQFKEKKLTAIVGESGSGKSTLAALLQGRLVKQQGKIFISGKEISECSEHFRMSNITYVGTNAYLFKGTVRENLNMANPNADEARLWTALKQVNLASFFQQKLGLDTTLDERGTNLSGGQRQRLGLARALVHDSPIYIFDEASSNVDVESEEAILKVIHNLAKTKTVIMITHRLANVKNADQIYVLEKGSLVESGTHENLIQIQGLYQNLYQTQTQLETLGGIAS